jgi:hypothetical protein
MKWQNLVAVVGSVALFNACDSARSAGTVEREELELRVADLELALSAAQETAGDSVEQTRAAETRAAEAELQAARARTAERAARQTERRESEPAAMPAPTPWPVAANPAPTPAPTPRPTPTPLSVASGSRLSIVLETAHSSRDSRVGDTVVARVSRAVSPDGQTVLPGGSYLEGRITEATGSGRVKGRARLAAHFDRLVVRGTGHPVELTGLFVEAAKGTKRDATLIGGGAAAGAVIGAIAGGKRGLGKGILIGGAAGTGAVLATKGEEVNLPAGSEWTVELLSTLRL